MRELSADLVGVLDSVLRDGGVRSVFQPIVDLDGRVVVAYEALARGPEGPLERPDRLFAAARDAGRLAELDAACRSAALRGAIEQGLFAPLTLFVNVEPEVLDSAPLDELLALCDDAPGQLRVVLEITERALAARPAELLSTVERVRSVGWGIAVDDVGADSLSLAFLPLLRPDVVKLDLRLVQERPGRDVAEIMTAVTAHAERTGALVLAEGIEDDRHLAMARGLGATLGQGWFFGRPAPGPAPGLEPAELALPVAASRPLPVGTPFDCVPPTATLRHAPKRLLIEVSKQLEREAGRLGETCVVAATFQHAGHFTPATARRYGELVERVGFVCALGEGLPEQPRPGLRGATLPADDPVRNEWDVVVLAPHFSAALLARDLGDDGADGDRSFEYALTYDRDAVVQAAAALLSRVAPRRPDVPVSPRVAPPAPVAAEASLLHRARELQRERNRYRAEVARLRERAGTDPLTGLPDRTGLAARVDTAIWDARIGDDALAVLFVDIEGVPAINALWGHDAGDELLCALAHRLRGRLRRRDVLARLGGHEFLVGLLDLDPRAAKEEARRIATELAAVVRRPVRLRGTDLPVGLRIGIGVFPDDGADFAALLRAAALDRYEHRPAPARG